MNEGIPYYDVWWLETRWPGGTVYLYFTVQHGCLGDGWTPEVSSSAELVHHRIQTLTLGPDDGPLQTREESEKDFWKWYDDQEESLCKKAIDFDLAINADLC